MIILHRITAAGDLAPMAIPLHNFTSANSSKDAVWVKSWDGAKVFSCKVSETLEDIQIKVFVARHGYPPQYAGH
jgi:hypothetical protein